MSQKIIDLQSSGSEACGIEFSELFFVNSQLLHKIVIFKNNFNSIHLHSGINSMINYVINGVHLKSDESLVIPLACIMATVVVCRVRNPAWTAARALGKERYING